MAIHELHEAGHSLQAVQRRLGLLGGVAPARYDHRDLSDPRWYQGWLESAEQMAYSQSSLSTATSGAG